MPDWATIRKWILSENSAFVLPSSVKLPILPKALIEFRQKAENPDADTNELSRIIASDAGLSTELLRNVNSSKYANSRKVTSVKHALLLLGIRSTLMFLTVGGIKQVMKSSSSKLINFQNFWNTNLERSLFSREVATLLNVDTDLAYTAGMLQDFLLPLITSQLFEGYLEFTENRDKYASLVEFEQETLGWNHAEAAAHVMHAWHFPDELVCCVYLHHRGLEILKDDLYKNTSVAAVAISSLLPDGLRQEADGLTKLMELENEWSEFDLMSIAEKVNKEFQETASDVKNHFSFLRVYQNALKRIANVDQAESPT